MRFVVIGISGSGKTTFARRLAARLGVRYVELDSLYWLPEWRFRDRPEFRAAVAEAVAGEAWVTDGNYSAVRDLVWPKATTIIWLNYPLRTVLWRLLRRTVRRARTQEILFSGNRESLRQSFLSHDSILLYALLNYRRTRDRYRKIFEERPYPGVEMIEVRNPLEAEQCLDAIVLAAETAGAASIGTALS
jgi:adenylate kinase family enzyme